MLRPSALTLAFFSVCAVALFGGCRTIYSDMYSPRRNYFKPVKDQPKPSEVLPPEPIPTTPVTPTAPPIEPPPAVPPPDPAPVVPPADPAPAPAIPGL